jgi:hypothetical protein
MHANVYTRERKHIGSIWSRVTCLALLLGATQGLGSRAPEDFQSHRHLTIASETSKYKQINKQYTKQCLTTKQTTLKGATRRYEHVSITIT